MADTRPEQIRASIPTDLRAWLGAEAERRGVSLSWLTWQALESMRRAEKESR